METILFAFPGNEQLTTQLARHTGFIIGEMDLHRFPDGEALVRILSVVKNKRAILVCSLDRPDEKFLALYFTARTLKQLGASRVELIAPYLAYMRQDKQFNPGEAITSDQFAALLSGCIDGLITVDPHLHRHKQLSEIYSVPAMVVHATEAIARWIHDHVQKPLVIGPDEESRQWVESVARLSHAPFEVLTKTRKDDHHVEVSVPNVNRYPDCTPVLVDDIISTAHTMVESLGHLKRLGMKPAVCIGVHALFAGNALQLLTQAGAGSIITCDSVLHSTNGIHLAGVLAAGIQKFTEPTVC